MSDRHLEWDPLSVQEVVELLTGLSVPWWIAGGQAIDLFVGRETRAHGDTDVLIRRDDQLEVQRHLAGWDLHKTKQPGRTGLKPWPSGEFLVRPVNDIWCRRIPDSPWQIQLMLLDTEGDDRWVFKRDPTIGGRIEEIGRRTPGGIPYLAPEIQLLYKAKPEMIEKDEVDFQTAMPLMAEPACAWLLACLDKRFPDGHAWIDELKKRAQT